MAIPKPAKSPRKSLQKKADTLASRYYRTLTPYCEAADRDTGINCGGGLQWCHILTRAILHMRYEPYNHLILCAGHHVYWTHSPDLWTKFLEQHFPERLTLANQNRNRLSKVDYRQFIDRFSTEARA